MNIPDKWVVIEIVTPHATIRKVLASWYGGFANGDSWKVSSGITKTIDNDNHYLFHNESGSIYQCFKHCQGMSGYTAGLLGDWTTSLPNGTSITVLDFAQ